MPGWHFVYTNLRHTRYNPDTACSYGNFGSLQRDLGDYISALQSHQRALKIRLKVLGENHPDTARSYGNIGVTQHELGDYTSALQSHQRALEIRLESLGENHPDTARSYSNIGVTQAASLHEIERTQLAALESALELD